MRLFALPDGVIDRKDRAQWLTQPFDLAYAQPAAVGRGNVSLSDSLQASASLGDQLLNQVNPTDDAYGSITLSDSQ